MGLVVVGVDDDFVVGQVVVVYWVVNFEFVGWVDVEFGVFVQLFGWQYWFDDFFVDGFDQVFLFDVWGVLG